MIKAFNHTIGEDPPWDELIAQAEKERLVEFHWPCLECGLPVEKDDNQRCNLCKKARREDPYD
jgi:rubrerythrin